MMAKCKDFEGIWGWNIRRHYTTAFVLEYAKDIRYMNVGVEVSDLDGTEENADQSGCWTDSLSNSPSKELR